MNTDRKQPKPSAETVSALRAFAERQLTPEEFDAMLRAPMSPAEREEILDLFRWFQRRYPTAGKRLAYGRRAYARWKRNMPG
jgi:hypothetical protein